MSSKLDKLNALIEEEQEKELQEFKNKSKTNFDNLTPILQSKKMSGEYAQYGLLSKYGWTDGGKQVSRFAVLPMVAPMYKYQSRHTPDTLPDALPCFPLLRLKSPFGVEPSLQNAVPQFQFAKNEEEFAEDAFIDYLTSPVFEEKKGTVLRENKTQSGKVYHITYDSILTKFFKEWRNRTAPKDFQILTPDAYNITYADYQGKNGLRFGETIMNFSQLEFLVPIVPLTQDNEIADEKGIILVCFTKSQAENLFKTLKDVDLNPYWTKGKYNARTKGKGLDNGEQTFHLGHNPIVEFKYDSEALPQDMYTFERGYLSEFNAENLKDDPEHFYWSSEWQEKIWTKHPENDYWSSIVNKYTEKSEYFKAKMDYFFGVISEKPNWSDFHGNSSDTEETKVSEAKVEETSQAEISEDTDLDDLPF